MKNDDDSLKERKTGEEEIIDFEFDELSEGTGDTEMTELDEKEIIELVDVVEMGEAQASPDSATAEIERLLDEEGTLDEVEIEEASDGKLEPEIEIGNAANSDLLGSVEEDEFELIESEETRAISEKGRRTSLEEETEDLTLDLDSALETITPLEREVSSQEWGEPEALEPADEDPAQVGRQEMAYPVDAVPYLHRRHVHVRAVFEGDADAALGRRCANTQCVNPVDRPENVFERTDDEPFDFFR